MLEIVWSRWSRCATLVAVWGALSACDAGSSSTPPAPPDLSGAAPLRALVITKTAGFRHESIKDAVEFFETVGQAGFDVTITEDTAVFTAPDLDRFDAVVFANTTGDILNEPEQAALERYVRGGGGFVGVHAAADTEHEWAFYAELLGARFVSHPPPVEAMVVAEDPDHAFVADWPAEFPFYDEWYAYDRDPSGSSQVILSIDPAVVGNDASDGARHPVAWYHSIEGGRSFYTNLGHEPATWRDPGFRTHLLAGLRWAAGVGSHSRTAVVRDLKNPMALSVLPDDRVLIIERTGEVRVYDPRSGRVVTAAELAVDTAAENGLLGVAVDPHFSENGFVYLYYSRPLAPDALPAEPAHNVLARFTLGSDGTLDLASELELLLVPSERRCCHEGGALAFAPDGSLFLSTGDNTDPFASAGAAPLDARAGRERFNARRTAANPLDLRGKILRVLPDGSVPSGNLFPADGTEGLPQIYAMGVRNPFRIAVDPDSGRLFFGDIGPDAAYDGVRGPRGYDEVNIVDTPGSYGWPHCIGFNRPYFEFDDTTGKVGAAFDCAAERPALIAYDYHTVDYEALGHAGAHPEFTGRSAIAGAVYRAPLDAPYALPRSGALLMTDWTRDILAAVRVSPSGELLGIERLLPGEVFHRPIDLEVAPDGALYVLEYGTDFWGDNHDAQLSRIEFSPWGRLRPSAALSAVPTSGSPPLSVRLSAAASTATGSDPIAAYEWDIGLDGTIDSAEPEFVATFDERGRHEVSLVVIGESGRRSLPAVENIVVGNAPPEVSITAPVVGTPLAAGQVVEFVGEAHDPEDGAADCAALTWNFSLGHHTHAHPFASSTGCRTNFTVDLGDHDPERDGVFLAVELVYTDRGGAAGEPALTGRKGLRFEVTP